MAATRLNLLADSILEALTERQRLLDMQAPTSHLDIKVHRNLEKLKTGITEFEREQNDMEQNSSLSSEELAQREDSFVALSRQYDRLLAMLEGREEVSNYDTTNDFLRSVNVSSITKTVRFSDTPDVAPGAQNGELLQIQMQIMDDQDRDLDALSEAISRQRELSLQIGDELEVHSSLLDETENALDNADRRLSTAKRRLAHVSKRAKEYKSTFIIIALIIILLILILIFKT